MEIKALLQGTECSAYLKIGSNKIKGLQTNLPEVKKRAHKGTYHKFSVRHLDKYVLEFSGRHNIRELEISDQMESIVKNVEWERLKFEDLVSGEDGRLN